MRGMNSESVDLIYLDPPFNSSRDYAAPIGSKAAGAEFKDTWTLDDIDVEWINLIEDKHPNLYRVIMAAMTNSDKSYLAYMAVRLLEMHRLLKATGSKYLHCDPTMSHYLKLMMDAIWGRKNFRNEISWRRAHGHKRGGTPTRYGRSTDVILLYSQGDKVVFNPYQPRGEEESKKMFNKSDKRGRYRAFSAKSNIWRQTPSEKYLYNWRGFTPPSGYAWTVLEDTLEQRYQEGTIVIRDDGELEYRYYLDVDPGVMLNDFWDDIPIANKKERTGYPTQKPVKLLERIIRASSNPGDVVFDPFCGCATTMVAAETLGRKWIGCDVSPKAAELVLARLEDIPSAYTYVNIREDVPRRTDLGKLPPANSKENKEKLYGSQGGHCAGCDEHHFLRHLEVDHIIARSHGGTDHLDNLQLLCGHCNRVKGNRGMEYLNTKLQLTKNRRRNK